MYFYDDLLFCDGEGLVCFFWYLLVDFFYVVGFGVREGCGCGGLLQVVGFVCVFYGYCVNVGVLMIGFYGYMMVIIFIGVYI